MNELVVIGNFVSNNLMASAATVGMLLEIVLRLIPSQKPQSILLLIASGCTQIGSIFTGIATFLNKVIPQNLK